MRDEFTEQKPQPRIIAMYQQKASILFEDEWRFPWSSINAVFWRFWKRHALEEADSDTLVLLKEPHPIFIVRTKDIEVEMCYYNFFLLVEGFNLFSGSIVLQGLVDGATRISLTTLSPDVSEINLSISQRKVMQQMANQQRDFLLGTFNAIVKWLPTQSSKKLDSNKLFLQSPNSILQVIHHIGKQFERLPATYTKKDEEDLRDHFLLFLEPLFHGSATGETFNNSGKTDILLRDDGKNIFIAECKFWKGEKSLFDTINQLLGYLTWRDTTASVIIFVQNKSFSPVLKVVEEAIPKHSNYLQLCDKKDETWLQYKFYINNDQERQLELSILLFHIPK